MDYTGMALIYEKNKYTKDGHKEICYKCIDYSIVGVYEFKNTGVNLLIFSGKYIGHTISINNQADYLISNMKTLNDLCNENNGIYDYQKFYGEFKDSIGKYYHYDKNAFYEITDKNILRCIKGNDKEYDDTLLDNGTDISQIYNRVKETIISQDEQIMQILTSLFKNQRVINANLGSDMISKLKENIIIYGATGTGKTEILKRIASNYNVPIVIEDATTLSETGYVGRNITDMLDDLYLASGKNLEIAEKGILVIDEFDKLSEKPNDGQTHISRTGVQRSLLKLLDGSTFYFNDLKFDTSRLSVVALGAFTGIVNNDNYITATQRDFVNYGIMRELMGRFSKYVSMNPLTKEDIKKILLQSNFSPLNTYKLLFESMNIAFSYDDSFVDYIATEAISLNSGARSLKTVVDNAIGSAMFRIFAGEYSAIHLTRERDGDKPYRLTKKSNS